MIEGKLARAIGISPHAPPQLIAEYLCRQADITSIPTLTLRAADWFVRLAVALGGHLPDQIETDPSFCAEGPLMPTEKIAEQIATALIADLRRSEAPMVLAAVAPDVIVGGCPARDLARMCRVLLGRHLVGFCRRVVEHWAEEGHLRN